mgnify:FL=1
MSARAARTGSPAENAAVTVAPEAAAEQAGLHYVSDDWPGISRRRSGKGFTYRDPQGRRITDPETRARIRKLAIPPAWTDVWISPDPRGHIQATGRDDRGRKQYRYHPRWREVRDETKYHRMLAFARTLPELRRRLGEDMARPGLPREKVLAAVVKLLESSLIRVGNEEYARANRSFGLTTLRDRHARIEGATIAFSFRGKSGKSHRVTLRDRRLARIVKACQDIPGQELFQYYDEDGQRCDVTSQDVNAYLREIAGEEFTAKDFRTWAGTVLAAFALQEFEAFDSKAAARRNITRAIEKVAGRLGNTPAICRKCYVHPEVFNAYLDGDLIETLRAQVEEDLEAHLHGLSPEEAAVLAFLQKRLAREAERSDAA